MRRSKTIEIDGAKFTFSALTTRQVEEFVQRQKDTLDMAAGPTRDKQLTQCWGEFIAAGLNNVMLQEDGKWPEPKPTLVTADEIPDRLDLVTFDRLRDEILQFSGLTSNSSEEKSPGEASAAS